MNLNIGSQLIIGTKMAQQNPLAKPAMTCMGVWAFR